MDFKSTLVMDIECYKNYLLVMFKHVETGKVLYFEKYNGSKINRDNILHILNKYTIVTFNGEKYDLVILGAALMGLSNEAIHKCSLMLIEDRMQPWQVRKQMGFAKLYCDHIDLIEVNPLSASLKIYGGRLHAPKLKDLPIHPHDRIKESDLPGMRIYCINDLDLTILDLKTLEGELDLRCVMSEEYKTDMRSKGDAQIAEAVIKYELEENYGIKVKKPKIPSGTTFKFSPPESLVFKTDIMQDIFQEFLDAKYTIGKGGHIELPENLKGKKFFIGKTQYKIGIGGLHSCEKKASYESGKYEYEDVDAATYYPRIIIVNKLAPKHLGPPFLKVYEGIVDRRLYAKQEKNKTVDASLKIVINGSFGKLGSKWSFFYAPDLMMQVTLTGQLSLLMLIEDLELNHINVVSGNTDGIVLEKLPHQIELAKEIISNWEFETGYDMEGNIYKGLYSKDVNNYMAVYADESKDVKAKGCYADPRAKEYILKKNPANEICSEAVRTFLKDGTPMEETITWCDDITKFVTIRTVNGGGAYYDGKLVGKAVRWYYGKHEMDCMRYGGSGNKVPRSDGAVPLMDLPDTFPDDVDFPWYIAEAEKMLKDTGYHKLK